MYEIIKLNRYTTVVKIPLKSIQKIEMLMARQPVQTMASAFNNTNLKPDFMINGGLFKMSNGATMSTTVDEGKKKAEGYFSNFGLWTNSSLSFGFDYYRSSKDLKDFLGGSPSLIINNIVNIDKKGLDSGFLKYRHPRSAIGMNADDFFIVTIDGRRLWAKGMSCTELAQFMKDKLSCKYAINLDGGGSTRMGQNVGGQLKILNSPTENRPVDSFLCVYLDRDRDYRVVTASALNIRQTPNGTILGTYHNGNVVEVLETDNGWCRTAKGWVFEKYLRKL